MKILFIWDGDYPWDIRVEKVCKSLHRDGYVAHMVCRNIARKPLEESYQNIQIHRLPYLPHWLGSMNNAFTFPLFFSPVWLWNIYKQAKANNCEVIIVRDLPMALAGIWISKILKIPCILDMAECYPEMLRCTRQFEGRSLKNFFLRNPLLADRVEKKVLSDITQVWVMIEESRDRLIGMGVPEEKIWLVSNTPDFERFIQEKSPADDKYELNNGYSMIYVGLLNPSRGLDTVIKAVSQYLIINPDFRLIIVGKGKAEKAYKALVKELEIGENVEFMGWVDNKKVPDLIAQADIGIVPHHSCSHWDNTIPNKLFDYMAAMKPVIVSDVPPMQRIVTNTNCGRVYHDYDTNDLCRVIDELSDPSIRENLAQNGINEIRRNSNWSKEEVTLLTALKSIEQAKAHQ